MKVKITITGLLSYQKWLVSFLILFCCNFLQAQTYCRPISQTNSQNAILLCIGLNVLNPNNAFDNDSNLTTYATLNNAIGVGCYVEETLKLNQTAKAGDQIVLYLGTGNGLLDVGLLSNATIQTKLSGVNVGPRVALNSSVLNLNLLSGNSIAVIRYTVTGDTDEVQIQVGGLLSLLVSLRIYDVRLDFAKPLVSGGLNQTICTGNSVSLSATPALGTSLAWYDSATSTSPLATGTSFTTPVLTANTTYYIGVSREVGCESSERVPVVINVSNPIAPFISSIGTSLCSSGPTIQTTLSVVNPILGTTYKWYSVATNGTSIASGNTFTPTVPLGTTSYYVEASIGSCVSPTRTKVDVISVPVPTPATILTQSVTIQSGQNATLTATTSEPGVTLNWFDVATGGTPVATNTSNYSTPILTSSKTYYVEAQSASGGCVSNRTSVSVTVIPTALGSCLEANSQQTLINGLCLLCFSTNPNYSVDGDNATAARLTIPVGLVNGWAQQMLQFNNPGKAGDIIEVELGLPGGLVDLSLLSYINLSTYNGSTFNNDGGSINSLLNVQLLGGNRFKASFVAGSNFDRVHIRLGGLATVLTSLDIYGASYQYKAPTISGNTSVCSGQATTLTAAISVGETVEWFDAPTLGNSLAATAAFTTTALTTDTTYYVQITRNGCVNSERFPVSVSVTNPIVPTVTANSATICSGTSATIDVQSPISGITYNWYDATLSGNLLFTGTSYTTPILTSNKSYFVEAVSASCSSISRAQVDITVNPTPLNPTVAQSNVTILSGQSATLQVSNPEAGITYDWYTTATLGTSLATGTSFTTPPLTSNSTYYIEAKNTISGCINSNRTSITVVINKPITACLRANSQENTQSPICTNCEILNEINSVDADNNNKATLTASSEANSYIQQTLKFSTDGKAGDIIDVELGTNGPVNISALDNVLLESSNPAINNGAGSGESVFVNAQPNIRLISPNRFIVSFEAIADFNGIIVTLFALANQTASLDIYGASYKYKDAPIPTSPTTICSGETATLTLTPVTGETYSWFDTADGTTAISTSNSFTTPTLTATTNYYLESSRSTCENSVRQIVTVNVLEKSTAADIVINSPLTADCAGKVVLSPTSALAGAQFKYYTDQTKTTEILNGTTGTNGETYAISSGELTITNLPESATPYSYFIAVNNTTNCENEVGTLKEVIVNTSTTTTLVVTTAPLIGCGSANLKDAISSYDTTGNTAYTFFDSADSIITADLAANITTSGTYSIQAQGNSDTCPSVKQPITVTINALPTLAVGPSMSVNTGNDVTLTATTDGTLVWYDPQGNALPSNTTGVLSTPGIYNYTVVASNANCSVTGSISINVIDNNSCQLLTERVYATTQSSHLPPLGLGSVIDGANAVDGNIQTYSTISTAIDLLGLGTTWQNLEWTSTIAQGTPVSIKLGAGNTAVALGESLTVIGTLNGVAIGNAQPISGSLLKLLAGSNTFEFTFIPADATGPKAYDGIRIISSSVLGVAQNTNVYAAYYNESVTTVACTPGDIEDIFYGAVDLGIGALTTTVGVGDPWNVADNDITTFATMYSGLGVLAAADLTVQFKTPSVVSDTLRIIVSKPGTLLDVNLLTGFTIQRYLGNVAVGAPIDNTSTLLSIRLLAGNSLSVVMVNSQPEPYDRVRIRLGGVAGVLESLRIHTIERVANTKIIDSDTNNKIIVCPGTAITLQEPEEDCSKYVWYDAETGGNVVANGMTFTVPSNLTTGVYKYYVQPLRYNCESYARGEVTVEVKATSPESSLDAITLNGATATEICAPSGTITLATAVSGTPFLTNPVYHWYNFDGTESQLIVGETASQLVVNNLNSGTYTYYVGVSSDEFCETAATDRKQITFTILPPSTKNDISVDNTIVCHDLDASLTPSAATLTNPIFNWYFDNNKTQPITNGAIISGVTYSISALGVLTASGLTAAMSPITYYVGVSSDTTCENLAGTLQSASIIINDPSTPTTLNNSQEFCLVDAPTVASIQVNETNVVWYDALTGGNVVDPTTALSTTSYFAALKDATTNCESSTRLEVAVNVTNPGTPTTTDASQEFCLIDAPTIANIQVNETNVVWYDALTGGNVVDPTTALSTTSYFAALKDATTNCESSTRLEVAVSVTNPGTPTTTDSSQEFCLVDTPTIASIQVNETNVVWYDALTGGNVVDPTTALSTTSYFAALKDATTNCESSTRLEVAVNVTNPGTPTTTDASQEFCLVDVPTIANIQVNETNVIWYDALTGGNVVDPTTALSTTSYFAALKDATTNCESSTRLEVAVSVTNPGTPTTTDASQEFCLINAPTVASIQVNETNVVWYDALTGGNVVDPNTALSTTSYFAALKDATTNCESATRLEVAVSVTNPATPTTTDTSQEFCLIDAPTVASIQVNETNVVWYDALTGGNVVDPNTTLSTTSYFAALKDATTNCESSTRLEVAVSVTNPGTPSTTDASQEFCLIDAPTVASIQVNETNVVWYDALTGGNVVDPTTALSTTSYFAALKDATTNCESSTRLEVAVNVTNPGTPTTTDASQEFCLIDAPTIAKIQVNETNVVWYDALTGGNVVDPTTALSTGIYFAALKDATTNCESSTRLEVAVNITNPGTPTTTDASQEFCLIDAPTVASIQVNETNVVWYDALTGGNVVDPTTALSTTSYFAALKDATTNCESAIRLEVAVSVTNPGTPTTTDASQDFCLVDAPTIASIQVNETNVVWYDALTGGNVVDPNTALSTTSYFAALKDGTTNCESSTRLEVAVSVTNPGTPTTTDASQEFCLIDVPTIASIQVNETNVIWYDALTGGNVVDPNTALSTTSYFAALKDATTNCESSTRLEVAVNVTNPGTPTTTDASQEFCLINAPTVASIQVNETNVVWYDALTGGNVVDPTTALSTTSYFAALKDATTNCESSTRLEVAVNVTNPGTPTTTDASQEFCLIDAPTIANIQVNETNVVWYDALTGGNVVDPTTALSTTSYFAALKDAATNCESAIRLEVAVSVTNPATPTTTDASQEFCLIDAPTVASIQVNETNVVWYDALTGGNVVDPTTALSTGTYYGAIENSGTCKSSIRLAVMVNVTSPVPVTTPRATQTFCLSTSPTIANLIVNELNVIWYSSATGGTPLAASTPLSATTYYATLPDNSTCDTATRTAIAVTFENNDSVQITTSDDTPCVFNEVAYSIANGKSDYVWTITNGSIVSGGSNSDSNVNISWSDIGQGEVAVTYINTCGETTTKSLNVTVATCSDLTITNTVSNPTPNFGEEVTFTVTVNNVGEGDFIDTIVSDLLPSGYNLISATTTEGTYDQTTQIWTIPTLISGQSVTLTIVAEVLPSGNYLNVATIEISTPLDVDAANNSASVSVDPICLTVYNEFTPNNDGANDLFKIDCIENYPNNELQVFNRYGALVYSKKHYENDWNGTANVSGVINRGDMLPTGTYFYVLDIGDGSVKKGWLSIMR